VFRGSPLLLTMIFFVVAYYFFDGFVGVRKVLCDL
jgi:hypothetical protein